MKRIGVFVFLLLTCHLGFTQLNYSIVPDPSSIVAGKGKFELNSSTVFVTSEECRLEAQMFLDELNKISSSSFYLNELSEAPSDNFVLFACTRRFNSETKMKKPNLPGNLSNAYDTADPGGYKIIVNTKSILISAQYDVGIFYATKTLSQMFTYDSGHHLKLPLSLDAVLIKDSPKFSHRGMLLDCCRHFMSKEFVMKYIDLLGYYKMNVLHWHLTEDQGWRIEIEKYPLLTEVGAWRTEADGMKYGGYYSKKEIKEIVAYAKTRHVTIIPEIELPGHSCAAIASYPFLSCTQEKIDVENEWGVFKDIYCAGNDSTFVFLENVLSEICELFPSSYIHIGGDEAPKFRWEHCEKCQHRMHEHGLKSEAELQTYFIERIAKFLETKGKKIIGWDEILEGGIPGDAMIQSWRGMEGGLDAAKAGHPVIMSPTSHCYFDYSLDATDMREVYSFNPIPDGLSPSEATWIRGGECNMWTEHAPQELVDSKVFPRILAMAEVLWSFPEQRNYDAFYLRVEKQFDYLNWAGVDFGFPEVPLSLNAEITKPEHISLTLTSGLKNSKLKYALSNPDEKVEVSSQKFLDYKEPLVINKPTLVSIVAEWNNKIYPENLSRSFDPHVGAGKSIQLTHKPSDWYTGGGNDALIDGRLGTAAFRDGLWQAVQGVDMEAIIDLGESMKIESIVTHWFHYGNAWIFRPSKVEYFISTDKVTWTSVEAELITLDEKTPGELVIPVGARFHRQEARYVKMVAHNNGPCPVWHDAPGEPSWLFCDEIIIH